MSKESHKVKVVLGILGVGFLNILVDICRLPHSSGWLVFDVFFWVFLVLAAAFGGRGENGAKSVCKETLVSSETLKPSGPFWNKPSAAYLRNNATPITESQKKIVLCLLLVPFGVLAYLFFR